MILKAALLTSVAPTLWMRSPRSWTSAERLLISLLSRTYSRACVLEPPFASPKSRSKSGWQSWICKNKGRRGTRTNDGFSRLIFARNRVVLNYTSMLRNLCFFVPLFQKDSVLHSYYIEHMHRLNRFVEPLQFEYIVI